MHDCFFSRARFQFQIPVPVGRLYEKVMQFICIYWQTRWNISETNCQNRPFLFASFRPMNTSMWKLDWCLCSESGQIAFTVSPRGNPVVEPCSQMFMCWGRRAKPLCQVIVRGKWKKVKVWFSLHDMWFSLRLQLKSFAVCSLRWAGPPACVALMPPLPFAVYQTGLKLEGHKERWWLEMWSTPATHS